MPVWVIACVRAFINFSMMAQYKSHAEATIGYMDDYLREFYCFKDVFLPYRLYKQYLKRADKARWDTLCRLAEERGENRPEGERTARYKPRGTQSARDCAGREKHLQIGRSGRGATKGRNARGRKEPPEDVRKANLAYEEVHEGVAGFRIPKMHLNLHYMAQIRNSGNNPSTSTDASELAHHVQIKDPFRRSNK